MFKNILLENLLENYSDAHLIAQRNAALPIEKGGLGLPPNNTAKDRAKALGYRLKAYHGTGTDIQSFDLKKAHDKEGMNYGLGLGHNKIYFAHSHDVANNWANNSTKRPLKYGSGDKPQVIPVLLKIDKPFDEKDYLNHLYDNRDKDRKTVINDFDKALKKSGHDGIIGDTQIAVYHPKNIRSIHAAFDPFKKDSADILS